MGIKYGLFNSCLSGDYVTCFEIELGKCIYNFCNAAITLWKQLGPQISSWGSRLFTTLCNLAIDIGLIFWIIQAASSNSELKIHRKLSRSRSKKLSWFDWLIPRSLSRLSVGWESDPCDHRSPSGAFIFEDRFANSNELRRGWIM